MSIEPRWLDAHDLIALNQRIVADTAEPHVVKDMGLLESAAARPRQMWNYANEEPDALELGVSLCVGVSQNHPFLQGNKRTGFTAMEIFLFHSGYELRVPDIVQIADYQVSVIKRERSEEDFVQLLDQFLYERPALDIDRAHNSFGHISYAYGASSLDETARSYNIVVDPCGNVTGEGWEEVEGRVWPLSSARIIYGSYDITGQGKVNFIEPFRDLKRDDEDGSEDA